MISTRKKFSKVFFGRYFSFLVVFWTLIKPRSSIRNKTKLLHLSETPQQPTPHLDPVCFSSWMSISGPYLSSCSPPVIPQKTGTDGGTKCPSPRKSSLFSVFLGNSCHIPILNHVIPPSPSVAAAVPPRFLFVQLALYGKPNCTTRINLKSAISSVCFVLF